MPARVLIVEDDEHVRASLRLFLEQEGTQSPGRVLSREALLERVWTIT